MNELLPAELMYTINRTAHVGISMLQYSLSRAQPEMMKKFFIKSPTKELSNGYDVATHFTPKYNPWDERLCVVPEADLFKAINKNPIQMMQLFIKA